MRWTDGQIAAILERGREWREEWPAWPGVPRSQEELQKENGEKERQKSEKSEVLRLHFMKAYGGVEI